MAETIELTRTARLVVETDTDAECPRLVFETLTGFAKLGHITTHRVDVPAVHEPPFDLAGLFYRLQNRREFVSHTDILTRRHENDVRFVARMAWAFYGVHLVYDRGNSGWWFADLPALRASLSLADDEPVALELQANAIDAARAVYDQWASGRVYEVTLQRLETYVHVTDSGSDEIPDTVDWGFTREVWEDVDGASLAGCYLDDEYTAQDVAIEFFDLTVDERAAAKGKMPASELDG